jgi:toxin YoeB
MIGFTEDALAQYWQWEKENRTVFHKINELIKNIIRDPFHGIGKPEPLKHDLIGHWSRRITEEHRLVYKVLNEQIVIISCKYHYK